MAKGSISHLRGLWGGRRWLGQLKHLSRKDAVGIQNTVNPLELFHRGTKAFRDGTKSVPNLHCYSHAQSPFPIATILCPYCLRSPLPSWLRLLSGWL